MAYPTGAPGGSRRTRSASHARTGLPVGAAGRHGSAARGGPRDRQRRNRRRRLHHLGPDHPSAANRARNESRAGGSPSPRAHRGRLDRPGHLRRVARARNYAGFRACPSQNGISLERSWPAWKGLARREAPFGFRLISGSFGERSGDGRFGWGGMPLPDRFGEWADTGRASGNLVRRFID